MKALVVLDDLASHKPGTASVWLARALVKRGHKVWLTDAGSLGVDVEDRVIARAHPAANLMRTPKGFLTAALALPRERLWVDEVDVMILRCNPGKNTAGAWAYTALLGFARLAQAGGALVLSAPDGLARGLDKLYFHAFPAAARPRGIVSRSRDDLRAFVRSLDGAAVIKPLSGSGGAGVFMVRPDDHANLNAIIEANTAGGYAVAQEHLPEAARGDVRMILVDGEPLRAGDAFAVVARVPSGGDLRSNVAAGGSAQPAEVSGTLLAIAAQVGPKLRADGIFLAGLDVIGDKLVEINIFSPGGLPDIESFTGADFATPLVSAIEARVAAR